MAHEVTMQDCINLLGLASRYKITATSSNNVCPVCGDINKPRKRKLNINFEKGVFRCNKCGFSGNTLDFWAHHRGLPQGDYKGAYKDYMNVYNSGRNAGIKERKTAAPVRKEETKLDFDNIDKVYRAFLNLLYLSDEHRANLKKRGLSDDAIVSGLYRSLPKAAAKSIPRKLLARGFELHGVPGFYKENGDWKFIRYGDGFLIPSLDVKGRIRALQVRMDTVRAGDNRYFTISTDGYEEGTKGTAAPHFVPGNNGLRTLVITEGPLKGNIISHITGYPVIAVLGVNTLGKLPEMLDWAFAEGTRDIKIAYDMDYVDNIHVAEACARLENILLRKGFRISRVVWDPGEMVDGEFPLKGLDDYLVNKN